MGMVDGTTGSAGSPQASRRTPKGVDGRITGSRPAFTATTRRPVGGRVRQMLNPAKQSQYFCVLGDLD